MGLTYIQASTANPARPRRSRGLKFPVGSGAAYSLVPAAILRRLGIKPGTIKRFILADGTEIKRSLGQALFRLNGELGASPVIFGEAGDSVLLGSVSREGLRIHPRSVQARTPALAHAPGFSVSANQKCSVSLRP